MRFIITSSDTHVTAVALIYTPLLSFVPSLVNSLHVFIICACICVQYVCVYVCKIYVLHMRRYLSFWMWLMSLNIIFFSSVHFYAPDLSLFLSSSSLYVGWASRIVSLSWLLWAVLQWTWMHRCRRCVLTDSFWHLPRTGVARPQVGCVGAVLILSVLCLGSSISFLGAVDAPALRTAI